MNRIIRTTALAAVIGAAAFALTACGSARTPAPTPARSTAIYEGAATAGGCVKLTEHGAELLTNDGYSATDYYPVGTWYAYSDSTAVQGVYYIGGEVGPDVQGTALYATTDLDLHDVVTRNTQADEAAQIDAYRDTWRDYKGLYPALARWDHTREYAEGDTAGHAKLLAGLAGCFGDGRTIVVDDPVAT